VSRIDARHRHVADRAHEVDRAENRSGLADRAGDARERAGPPLQAHPDRDAV
jgi:hypothetical protein